MRGGMAVVRAQWRVILALMLHDIRSRAGGSAIGFLMLGIAWPLSHIFLLLVLYAGIGRTAPYGESAALWFATGIIPFLAFQYMSRFVSLGFVMNRSLLSFPAVNTTDILFARATIEVLNTGLVVLVIFAVFAALGIDLVPKAPTQAGIAMLSMMLLGLGFGLLNAVIAAAVPAWLTAYALLMIMFWISSGILFVPDALPDWAQGPLSYLPWLQGVEWMRSTYYDGFGSGFLAKTYLVECGMTSLLIGLLLERMVRGKLR